MKIEICKMSVEDLTKMDLKDFDDFWNKNMLKEELELSSSFYIIARFENNIVGFAGMNLVLDEAHLANIVVKKDMRDKKIGTQLLESLLAKAKELASSITLEVNAENLVAIHLYEKYGFEKVGKRNQYYDHQFDAYLMTKYF